jgi:hypothetical protein
MISWLRSALRLPGFKRESWGEEHDTVALHFLSSPDVHKLVAYISVDKELVLLTPYSVLPVAPKTFQYFVKREPAGREGGGAAAGEPAAPQPLSMANIKRVVQMGFVNGGGVDSMLRLMTSVVVPTLGSEKTAREGPAAAWPESVRLDFLGQTQRCVMGHAPPPSPHTYLLPPPSPSFRLYRTQLHVLLGGDAPPGAGRHCAVPAARRGPV